MASTFVSDVRAREGINRKGTVDRWPEDGLEWLGQCPVCQSDGREILHDGLTDRVSFCAPGTWTLWACTSCKCAYLDPRPNQTTIGLAYASYPTHDLPSDFWDKDTQGVWHIRWRRAFANGYRNWRQGAHLQPATRLGVPLVLLFPGARERLDGGVYYLPRYKPGATLLDVGCGSGAFLRKAQRIGWKVAGVEPDPKAAATASSLGLNVIPGTIDSLSTLKDEFDVVTISQVVEHVHDPDALLRTIFQLLKPGGQLFIATPNISSLAHHEFGEHWRGLEPPRHLILFGWESLELMLKRAGFDQLSRLPPDGAYNFMARASEQIRTANGMSGKPRAEPAMWVARTVAKWRTRINYKNSEFVRIWARKPEKRLR